jgi:serine/threonine protein phosphatase 1
MVCGHTEQQSGVPLNVGHAVCLDTWVYGQGWLTCLDVASGQIWQANQRGQRRGSNLNDYLDQETRT